MYFKNVFNYNLLLIFLGFLFFSACNPNENYHRLSSNTYTYNKSSPKTKRKTRQTRTKKSSAINNAVVNSSTDHSKAISSTRRIIVDKALSYKGIPYHYGGKSPQSGFDCSGLITHCFSISGQHLKGSSSMMAEQGKPKALGAVVPGDLLFFGSSGKVNHVAIAYKKIENEVYIIHATSKAGVKVENISKSKYWMDRYLFTRDLID